MLTSASTPSTSSVSLPLGPDPTKSALEKAKQSNQACQKGDFDTAIKLYTEAIALSPGNHILFSNRSAAFLKTGQFQKALQDAIKAKELSPEWPKVSHSFFLSFSLLSLSTLDTSKHYHTSCQQSKVNWQTKWPRSNRQSNALFLPSFQLKDCGRIGHFWGPSIESRTPMEGEEMECLRGSRHKPLFPNFEATLMILMVRWVYFWDFVRPRFSLPCLSLSISLASSSTLSRQRWLSSFYH